jgi:hypothetical protein
LKSGVTPIFIIDHVHRVKNLLLFLRKEELSLGWLSRLNIVLLVFTFLFIGLLIEINNAFVSSNLEVRHRIDEEAYRVTLIWQHNLVLALISHV